jgi:hypothetical protein
MAEVVNLRTIRKRAAKQRDDQRAAENRAIYGTPKAERQLAKARDDKARRDLDQHRVKNGGD